jgi:hypothetical protein
MIYIFKKKSHVFFDFHIIIKFQQIALNEKITGIYCQKFR